MVRTQVRQSKIKLPVWTDCILVWCKNRALSTTDDGLVMFLVVRIPSKTIGDCVQKMAKARRGTDISVIRLGL